uniref:Serine aminopeptidase S33 domain-containing protein n=1 Tax=Hanusia phi TaxID=3032 RepID=A0A7S0EDW7_9CRYP|mmetsp:Transcript_21510/g.48741  ORF Transcript_21510/g.48741 Transcript_21510/m.48741 type:complete len:337 (+) Transcript_21510:252-1262(+)
MTEIFAALICRPPRHSYTLTDLGPARFRMDGKLYSRTDFQLYNKRGLRIECSHYRAGPNEFDEYEASPCVVYLHGNCGSRVDADEIVEGLLEEGVSVFSLDFSGCGLSDGDLVSLGYFEQDDLSCVLEYLANDPSTTSVAIWGRSMGAVVALLVAGSEQFKGISCLILDSPYSSLQQLLEQLAHKYIPQVPLLPYEKVVEAALLSLRQAVRQKANYDLFDVETTSPASRCRMPALFAHAKDDQLIPASHSKLLMEAYAGEKELLELDGDHNSARESEFLKKVSSYLVRNLSSSSPLSIEKSRKEVEKRALEPQHSQDPVSWFSSFVGGLFQTETAR